MEERAERIANITYTHPNEDGSVPKSAARIAGGQAAMGAWRGMASHARAAFAQGRPQRPVPLRQRQEVQAVPRQAGLKPPR